MSASYDRTRSEHGFVLGLLLFLVGCSGPEAPPPSDGGDKSSKSATGVPTTLIRFEEVTASSGVNFQYRNGEEAGEVAILESLGGGVGLFDLDGDGLLDLCLPGGGHHSEKKLDGKRDVLGWPHVIYRNDGDWHFTDVTALTLATTTKHYSHGAAAADYDNDGFCDVLITGYGGLLLLRNQGDGTLVEVAQPSGLTDRQWSSSAAWGDFDKDGTLDVFIAHYVNWSFDNHPFCAGPKPNLRESCPPREFKGLSSSLYLSNGEGTFRDVTEENGVQTGDRGKGLGVVVADLDMDGDLDIYVGNDTVANFLFRNDGTGKFEEVGLISGTALSNTGTPDGSMGVDVGDYNLDGLPDLWVANFERESIALYRNDGNCLFQHVSQGAGVTAVGALYVGWGTAFGDLDLDGDEDPFVSNGHVIRYPENAPVRQKPLLFENAHGKRLTNVAASVGPYFQEPHQGRGCAAGDLDRDGDLDLVISCLNEPVALLSNTTKTGHHWLSLRLIGRQSPRLPIGAIVKLKTNRGEQIRLLKGGSSFASTVDSRLHFGLGAEATAGSCTIHWPSGTIQTLPALDGDRAWVVVEESAAVIDR
jgi:hypothetical protein